jgi:hypothetical protein
MCALLALLIALQAAEMKYSGPGEMLFCVINQLTTSSASGSLSIASTILPAVSTYTD